jgi:hypothetical protein
MKNSTILNQFELKRFKPINRSNQKRKGAKEKIKATKYRLKIFSEKAGLHGLTLKSVSAVTSVHNVTNDKVNLKLRKKQEICDFRMKKKKKLSMGEKKKETFGAYRKLTFTWSFNRQAGRLFYFSLYQKERGLTGLGHSGNCHRKLAWASLCTSTLSAEGS